MANTLSMCVYLFQSYQMFVVSGPFIQYGPDPPYMVCVCIGYWVCAEVKHDNSLSLHPVVVVAGLVCVCVCVMATNV